MEKEGEVSDTSKIAGKYAVLNNLQSTHEKARSR